MKKILFIGNSHTYMNDMPELARQMMENATGEACEVFMLANPGKPLKWHMEEDYYSVRFNVLYGKYDYCVIQEQAHPLPPEEDTVESIARLIDLCKKANIAPVIFETWAEKRKPENQDEMNRRYRKLAREYGAILAPVGEVWEKTLADLNDQSEYDLYFRDGEHASAVGDYLAAMVTVKAITGKMPLKGFRRAFDFTIPGENKVRATENISDEELQLPEMIVEIIRDNVEKY